MQRMIIAALGIIIGTFAIAESAFAQTDFYDRSNRGRRSQDWGRGFNDGRDCNQMKMEVVQEYCRLSAEYYSRRTGRRGYNQQDTPDCRRAREDALNDQDHFMLSAIADGRSTREWTFSRDVDALEEKAERAKSCYLNRRDSFERDTQADSDRYHREQERRQRRQTTEPDRSNEESSDDESDFLDDEP